MTASTLRLHHLETHSRANGPGERIVLWTQGCSLGCAGCFNPQTHPTQGGQLWKVTDLVRHITSLQHSVEGITLSGGEPLQQMQPVLRLLREVRRLTSLSIILFTGFSWQEIHQFPHGKQLLASLDVLLAGRYVHAERLATGLRGSASKTVHLLTGRYNEADLAVVPPAEVILDSDGTLTLSGIDPLLV